MKEPWGDPQELLATIARIAAPLQAIEVGQEMHTSLQEEISRTLDEARSEADRNVLPAARTLASSDLPPALQAREEAAQLYRRMAILNSWLDGRGAASRDCIDAAAELASSDTLRETLKAEQQRLRDDQIFEDVLPLCRRGMVDQARKLLLGRRATTDPGSRKRIDEFLAEPRNFATPVSAAPSMATINGIGTVLWGRRAARPDGSYIATLCFCFVFVPLIPLRAYVVRSTGFNSYMFLASVSLSPFARWWRRMVLGLPLLLVAFVWGLNAYETSPYIRETNALRAAQSSLDRGHFGGAIAELGRAVGTQDPERRRRVDGIATAAVTRAIEAVHGPDELAGFVRTMGGPLRARPQPQWFPQAVLDALERKLFEAARQPQSGEACRDFIEWSTGGGVPAFALRRLELAVKASETCGDVALLAAAVRWHRAAETPSPEGIVRRLGKQLVSARHPQWEADAMDYLAVAPPDEARALLFLRAERAWKGLAPGPELRGLASAPEPLRVLLALDDEKDLEKRAGGLEKIADAPGLPATQQAWHRLGVARRLSELYGKLNEEDPLRFPVTKARPWALAAAELAPDDLALRGTAMRFLVDEGEFARAISLGEKPGRDFQILTWLGLAYARSGRPEEAERVLRPFVTEHLEAYVTSLEDWNRGSERVRERLYDSLRNGTGNQAFIARLNRLSKEEAGREAERWVRTQIEGNPTLAAQAATWRKHQDVYPAALELSMVQLDLGRALPAGEGRKRKLEEAEKLFLLLRRVNEDDPNQELQLGQVYFWLGKHSEGQAIYDSLEKAGDGRILLDMGEIYRALAMNESARRVLEASYEKLPAAQRPKAASLRAITWRDLEDRIAWLEKCDGQDAYIRSELSQARAEKLAQEGKHAEAVAPLKEAAAYYAGRPENSTTLNNFALIHQELARLTGDAGELKEALRLMRRAGEQAKNDAIVLTNQIALLQYTGYHALSGGVLRGDLLHQLPGLSWTDYERPQPSRTQWAERVRSQAELRRAAELGPRATVLSPESSDGLVAQFQFLLLTRDAAGLRKLRESVEASPPARLDAAPAPKKSDSDLARRRQEGIDRAARQVVGARKAGHPATLAYALLQQSDGFVGDEESERPGSTLDDAIRCAEEAISVWDVPVCRRRLASLLALRSSRSLARQDEGFRKWRKSAPGCHPVFLLELYGRRHPSVIPALRALEDLRRGGTLLEGHAGQESLYVWVHLALAGHARAEEFRNALVAEGMTLDRHRIELRMSPDSAGEFAETWLCAKAFGDDALADALQAEARRRKIFTLFFGE